MDPRRLPRFASLRAGPKGYVAAAAGAREGRRVVVEDKAVMVDIVELVLDPRRKEGWNRLDLRDDDPALSGYSNWPISATGVPTKSDVEGHVPNVKSCLIS